MNKALCPSRPERKQFLQPGRYSWFGFGDGGGTNYSGQYRVFGTPGPKSRSRQSVLAAGYAIETQRHAANRNVTIATQSSERRHQPTNHNTSPLRRNHHQEENLRPPP